MYIGDDLRFTAIVVVIYYDNTDKCNITVVALCCETGKILCIEQYIFFALLSHYKGTKAQYNFVLLGYQKK